MKQLTPLVASHIQKLGIEPVNILAVQWVKDGPFIEYADKTIDRNTYPVEGVILNLSNLEAVIKLDSQGQTQGISVTLDDTDGTIKEIINVHDIHGRTVRLMQWFEGLPLSESFQLYEGVINSPIIWSEGDRTISFTAITQLSDKEVGFSPEEANFDFLPDNLVGKPWPMVFGLVQNVPGTRLQDVPLTQSGQDLGVSDPTLLPNISRVDGAVQNLRETLLWYFLALLQAEFTADYGDTPEQRAFGEQAAVTIRGYITQIENQLANAVGDYNSLTNIINDQQSNTNDTLQLLDTTGFPSGPITLQIEGLEVSGTLTGNVFSIDAVVDTNFDGTTDEPYGFTFISAGSTITLKTEKEITYIANIIDSEILTVQVYRQIENGQVLVTIPSSWYTVQRVESGPYQFVILSFSQAISSRDSSLGDDIYINQESTIGPNIVDIMVWLIETYTDLTWDTTSFNSVKLLVENYPAHFAKLDRPNIFEMLEEMAFQARCAIWVVNRVIYIKYLPIEDESVTTISEDDIDAGSLTMLTTETEELVTKFVAEWTNDYAANESNKIILRHNVAKYGTRERVFNFYIYNLPELVLKSATFWLIRFSNIWKLVNFKTYVNNLSLETFDTFTLSLQQPHIANDDVKCFVRDLIYDTSNHLLDVQAWVPIRFGEMTPYDFGWPSQILPEIKFPTSSDIINEYAGSAGPGADVDTEKLSISIGGPVQVQVVGTNRRDYGEETPSDLDDVRPVPNFKGKDFTVGEAPSYDYSYRDYPVDLDEPDEPTDDFDGAVFPGIVRLRFENENWVREDNFYQCDLYLSGLNGQPTSKYVKQLQGVDIEDIPNGTWVLVAKNRPAIDEETGEYIATPNDDDFEWTMQVPIWL